VADIPSDGYALIKVIRECNLEYRGFTPAIAIMGFGSAVDEKRAVKAGFNAYLPKPIEPADLVTAITRVLHDSTVLAA
jgi:CheY-like chemotaxis protein